MSQSWFGPPIFTASAAEKKSVGGFDFGGSGLVDIAEIVGVDSEGTEYISSAFS